MRPLLRNELEYRALILLQTYVYQPLWSLKKMFPFEKLFTIDKAVKFVDYWLPFKFQRTAKHR